MLCSKVHYLLIFFISLGVSFALECYVCKNQEKNHEKCLNTIQTCEQEEDMCLSEIKWGSPPYWTRGNTKQYYVSKRCSSRSECEKIIQKSMSSCTYIWYYDWKCSECCAGDRCNYYVTLTGNSIQNNVIITSLCIILIGFSQRLSVSNHIFNL
ncbi:hypothetical protein PGB90_005374 [Kerria lacca]